MGKQWKHSGWLFGGSSKITADGDCSHEIKRRLLLGRKVMTNLDSILENRDITLPTKIRLVRAMVFPVVMYGCESWTRKKAECWRLMLLNCGVGKTLESPLDCEESQPVHPKGNQSWIFIGRTDAEAEAQYFGHMMQRTDSLKKTLMLGKIEGRKKSWRQRMRWLDSVTKLNGHEFEQAPGFGDGQGGLACYSPWGCKESDMTEWLNWII